MDQIAQARQFQGWFIRGIVRSRLEAPRTRLPLDEEYWLAMRHPAEVASAGEAQLASTNAGFAALPPAEREHLWREFRAYVRQAEGFYRGACVLPWKSSPLNYYYSFMNLAKAIAVTRGLLAPQPAQSPRALQHGLSARVVQGTPDKWKITAKSTDGVFALLYQATVGVPIPDSTEMDARELLGYVISIRWQLEKSGSPAAGSWFPCHWVFLSQGDQVWDVIGISRGAAVSRLPATLSGVYQELSPEAAKPLARETLGLQAVQAQAFRFLQRTTPIQAQEPGKYNVGEIEQSLRAAMPNCVFEYLDGTDFQFCIGLPYEVATGTIPMNELAASYAVLYFLSSVVRYHPDYMDHIGESTDAWLIESFAKSAPLSLLRQLVAAALGYTLIIEAA